jgi:cytochrome c-type biogenesis protein CcsB
MAELSDQLLVVAILGYLAAMLGYAAEYSFGGRGAIARAASRAPRERELVGVADASTRKATRSLPADLAGSWSSEQPPITTTSEPDGRAALFGRLAVMLTGLAVLAHAGVVVTRGLAAGRVPWGNMYEFVVAVTLVGSLAWLAVLARRPVLRPLGLYVAVVQVLLLGLAGMVLYTSVTPLVPALNSYWLAIHVTAAVIASGVFLVGFVAAAMYLVRAGHDAGKSRFPYSLGARLPAADGLERLTFRLTVFAFPIWTFAVIAGAIWAEAAWGRYWGWDPKETWAFISWVAYAGYLHARATPSVKRTTATWIAVLAWGTMLMNLFGVNIFFEGLHSYADVD